MAEDYRDFAEREPIAEIVRLQPAKAKRRRPFSEWRRMHREGREGRDARAETAEALRIERKKHTCPCGYVTYSDTLICEQCVNNMHEHVTGVADAEVVKFNNRRYVKRNGALRVLCKQSGCAVETPGRPYCDDHAIRIPLTDGMYNDLERVCVVMKADKRPAWSRRNRCKCREHAVIPERTLDAIHITGQIENMVLNGGISIRIVNRDVVIEPAHCRLRVYRDILGIYNDAKYIVVGTAINTRYTRRYRRDRMLNLMRAEIAVVAACAVQGVTVIPSSRDRCG